TTILGMLPTALSLGEGGETMQPLAIVIMGGLTVSKIVVAVVIKTGLNLAAQPIETKPIKSLLRFVFL
ncbi:efflux RND transporter permease subunit, partial [Clostridioides difficile]|uniref:efflux RND transporter permease subunit n=1 Tax=Clostridioides difficile TaxID=1496 RepID=UPI0018DDF3AF